MFRHSLALLFLAGATTTLAAQSNVSFETYADTNQTPQGNTGVLVAGDFNSDGKPDLIECCDTSTQMVFKAGNGDGTFQAPVPAYSTPVAIGSIVAVDVNGDGKLDLVAMAAQNPPQPPGEGKMYLTVWLGNGNGTFQTPQTYTTTQNPTNASVMVGNFFGDGHPDIAVAESSSTIDLFRNQGNGTFTYDKSINTGGGYYAIETVAAGNINGTGVSDLAVLQLAGSSNGTGSGPQQLYVLWNDGKGNFTQQQLNGSYNNAFAQLTISRLNGDAMADILVSYACPDNNQCVAVDAFYGQGNNTVYKRTLVSSTGVNPADVRLTGVDVNGDGYGDLVAFGDASPNCPPDGCTNFPAGVFVWLGNADGSFQQTPQQFITSNDAQLGMVAMADFNRDGMMDFAQTVPGAAYGSTEYYINATARTTCGKYTISPTVTVCQPVDNTYSPSPVRVEANGYDTTPITAMQEYIDGSLKYSEPVTSFDQTFSLALGTHFLVAKGWDKSGRDFVADRTVTVYSGTPGPVCPTAPNSANICLPSSATVNSPVEILANGDTGVYISTAAQLYIDGKLVVDNQASCYPNNDCFGGVSYVQTTQVLAPGTHNLVFKVWDTAGSVYEAQKTISVN
jgi:FG-GAP-like repeat